jgi:hypothetical protein
LTPLWFGKRSLPMTEEHLFALLAAGDAKKEERGHLMPEGRTLTLYAGYNGANLTVSRVQAVKLDKGLLHAQTSKGEYYVLALVDCFAGSLEAPPTASGSRKAGFV